MKPHLRDDAVDYRMGDQMSPKGKQKLVRGHSLANLLETADKNVPYEREIDKNKAIELTCHKLIEEIFKMMNQKGLIPAAFGGKTGDIERLRLIEKYSNY
jgi:hypothetical protein